MTTVLDLLLLLLLLLLLYFKYIYIFLNIMGEKKEGTTVQRG